MRKRENSVRANVSPVLVGWRPLGNRIHFFGDHGPASAGWDITKAPSSNEMVQLPISRADLSHPEEVRQFLDKSQDTFCNLLLPKI